MLFGEIITYIYSAHTRENYKKILMTKDNYKLTYARERTLIEAAEGLSADVSKIHMCEKNIPKTDYRFSV